MRSELDKVRKQAVKPSAGHNQGPPLDDVEPKVHQRFDLVWPILDELEEEIEKPEPSPDKLQKLARRLWEIFKVVAGYCGSKIDVALNKAAEEAETTGTKWAIRTGVAVYAGTNEGVQNVAFSAWKYALALLN